MKPYYQDDQVTLYHGNCLELADLWAAADVLVTDPPYGVDWTGHNSSYRINGERVATSHKAINGDHDATERDAALELWGNKPRVIFGSWRTRRPEPVDHRLIWHKQGMPPGPLNAPFMLQDEEIYVTGEGFRPSSPPLRSVIATNEIRQGKSGEVAKTGHPTPKPVGLMEVLIDRCPPGTIADPFSGAGATLIAARNLGRKAVGIELEERYCEVAATRLSQTVFDLGALA